MLQRKPIEQMFGNKALCIIHVFPEPAHMPLVERATPQNQSGIHRSTRNSWDRRIDVAGDIEVFWKSSNNPRQVGHVHAPGCLDDVIEAIDRAEAVQRLN